MGFLIKGFIIGLSIAAPVGPIGVLCIRRTLAYGRANGLVSGLGAATADALYGSVAAFGLAAIAALLIKERPYLSGAGGAFLCYLGVRTFLSPPAPQGTVLSPLGLAAAYLSTLLLTLANPMTVVSFVAVFAGLGLGTSPAFGSATWIVIGVFAGSALWWLFLSTLVGGVRKLIDVRTMRYINWTSGGLILALGIYSLTQLRSWR